MQPGLTLFNIYYSAVVTNWRDHCPVAGVNVRFKHGRKLVGDRTVKSYLNEVKVTESQFTDDIATNGTSREILEQSVEEIVNTTRDWGLTVNTEKTKGMVAGASAGEDDMAPLQMKNG